jgi:hypothetical protein
MQMCISLFTLMVGVFVHPELVIEPGINQLGAALLVLIATIGITFSLQAVFADRPATDVSIRVILAAFALLILLCPENRIATVACLPVIVFIGYWLVRRRAVGGVAEVAPADLLPANPVPVPVVDTERGRMS